MLVLVLICAPLYLVDERLVFSAIVGGLIFIIPNAYFLFYALRFRGASQAFLVAQSFFQGLMGKLALSAAGFAVAFSMFKNLHVLTMLLVYMVMVFLQVWIAGRLSNKLEDLWKSRDDAATDGNEHRMK